MSEKVTAAFQRGYRPKMGSTWLQENSVQDQQRHRWGEAARKKEEEEKRRKDDFWSTLFDSQKSKKKSFWNWD